MRVSSPGSARSLFGRFPSISMESHIELHSTIQRRHVLLRASGGKEKKRKRLTVGMDDLGMRGRETMLNVLE